MRSARCCRLRLLVADLRATRTPTRGTLGRAVLGIDLLWERGYSHAAVELPMQFLLASLAFFVSGAAALVYQVTWQRLLALPSGVGSTPVR